MEWLRADMLTADLAAEIDDTFAYHKWDELQVRQGEHVRESIATACKVLIRDVPPSPTRTRAINLLLDARMLANSAITFRGRL